MPTKVVIIAGRKQSGKDTSAQFLMNHLQDGRIPSLICKQYSFAKPLKDFLVNVMGLTTEQCWGTDQEKNTPTAMKWDELPLSDEMIITLLMESRDPSKLTHLKKNPWLIPDGMNFLYNNPTYMTAREVMQVFGSNICRKMNNNCWAAATKKKILAEKPDYAFITDARFPNEIDIFLDLQPIVVRLLRNPFDSKHVSEVALDNYDWARIPNLIQIDNREITIEEKCNILAEEFRIYK